MAVGGEVEHQPGQRHRQGDSGRCRADQQLVAPGHTQLERRPGPGHGQSHGQPGVRQLGQQREPEQDPQAQRTAPGPGAATHARRDQHAGRAQHRAQSVVGDLRAVEHQPRQERGHGHRSHSQQAAPGRQQPGSGQGQRPQQTQQQSVEDPHHVHGHKGPARAVAGRPQRRGESVEERRLHGLVGEPPDVPAHPELEGVPGQIRRRRPELGGIDDGRPGHRLGRAPAVVAGGDHDRHGLGSQGGHALDGIDAVRVLRQHVGVLGLVCQLPHRLHESHRHRRHRDRQVGHGELQRPAEADPAEVEREQTRPARGEDSTRGLGDHGVSRPVPASTV